jgi:hypothetical protein
MDSLSIVVKNYTDLQNAESDSKNFVYAKDAIRIEVLRVVFRNFSTFDDFVLSVYSYSYFLYIINSGYYTVEELLSTNWQSEINIARTNTKIIEKLGLLQDVYKLLRKRKTNVEIKNILKRYDGWFYVLLQRIYKKYVNSNHEIIKKTDFEEEIDSDYFLL